MLHLMVTWAIGLNSRLVFHSPIEFFVKVFRVRLIVYSSCPSTLSCYEALIHRLSCSYSRQCTDCFFFPLQSQLTVLTSSRWTFTSLVHSVPHSCIETCAHSSWLLWCLTGVPGCTEAGYLLACRWIWLNFFVDPLESQSSSPALVDQLSFYYTAMDMVKWRTLSLFSWLFLSFSVARTESLLDNILRYLFHHTFL